MSTWVLIAGALVGLGATLVVAWVLPAQPSLADALHRLDPAPRSASAPVAGSGFLDRGGLWLTARLPTGLHGVSDRDLQLLRLTKAGFLGQRLGYALIGLLFPTLFTTLMALLGLRLPVGLPFVAGVGLAGLLSLVPVVDSRHRARQAREEFTRSVASYMDLVALDKRAGAGTSAALHTAATIGDSWAFERIRDAISRAEWAGTNPWDALSELGQEVGVPALSDLGDIMRLSGVEGVGVYSALRGRAAAARDQLLATDQSRANSASEALAMPVAGLGLAFLALLGTPALLQIAFTA